MHTRPRSRFHAFLLLGPRTLLACWLGMLATAQAVEIQVLPGTSNVVELLDRSVLRGNRGPAGPTPGTGGIDDLRQALRTGRLGRIEALAPGLLAAQPDDPQLNGLHGIALASRGDLNAARDCLQKARAAGSAANHARLIEAILLRQQGDRPGAVRAAQEAVDADPGHPFGWNVLGRAVLDTGDLPGALRHFQKAIELNEAFYPAHLNLGAVAFQQANPSLAATAFSKAADLEPTAVAPRFGLALSLEAQGQFPPAIDQLRLGLDRNPDDPLLLPKLTEILLRSGQANEGLTNALRMDQLQMTGAPLLLADAFLRRGDDTAAAAQLARVPATDPHRHYLAGYRHIARREYREALAAMEQVLSLAPAHRGAPLALIALRSRLAQPTGLPADTLARWPADTARIAHFLAGCDLLTQTQAVAAHLQFQSAAGCVPGYNLLGVDVATLQKAIPPSAAPDLALGVLLHIKGLNGAARAAFERMLQTNPNSFMAHYWLGLAALDAGDRPSARTRFLRCLDLAPTFFPALYAAGELTFSAGDPAGATPLFERARKVAPDPGLALRLGLIHENAGNLAEAERHYRDVVHLAPGFFAGYNQLAWFLASRGRNLEEALRLAERADSLLPGNSSILDTLGWIHHQLNRPEAALDHLQRAAAASPANPTIWYHLGAVHHRAGNIADAKTALERALSLPTPFTSRQAAVELLEKLRAQGTSSGR